MKEHVGQVVAWSPAMTWTLVLAGLLLVGWVVADAIRDESRHLDATIAWVLDGDDEDWDRLTDWDRHCDTTPGLIDGRQR
jgi:hypothetical protein